MSRDMRPHWSFWVIAGIAFLWNAMGAVNFIVQMNPDMHEMYRDVERAIIDTRPTWATIGFAVSVFVGALAGVLLLLRKSFSIYGFIVSLLGAIAATVHTVSLSQSNVAFTGGELVVMAVMPVVASALFVWYAMYVKGRGWSH